MPTRSYKLKANSSKSQKDKTEDAEQEISEPPLKKTGFIRTATNEMDRLFMHTTEELKMQEPHFLFPAFNVSQASLESLDDLRVYPTCEVSTPRAIFISNQHYERVDICHRRTLAREFYRKRLHFSRTRYQTVQKNKALKTNEKKGTYHTSIFDLARRLECDPDPFFHGSYDYYYSGGNLTVLPENGGVVHVNGTELNNLNIGMFSNNLESLNTTSYDEFEPAEEVFEVCPIKNFREDNSNYFAVRQRNKITLRCLHPNGRIKGLLQFKTNYTPFISFAQSSHELNKFVISTMKQSVRVYDVNKPLNSLEEMHNISSKDQHTRINWNVIKPWREHTFLYANEHELFFMDLRTNPTEWLKSKFGVTSEYNKCDFISSICKSEFRNLIYVGTSHKLHCLDMRFLGRDFESENGALCRWVHQLEYAPAFLSTFRNGASEFVALSSALADDLHICELTRERNVRKVVDGKATEAVSNDVKGTAMQCKYKSYSLPYKPPTLEEAHHQARLSGMCLQPEADLKTRIQRCTTGLTFYDTSLTNRGSNAKQDNLALLLTANSVGDVYARSVTECTSQELEERRIVGGEKAMRDYAQKVIEFDEAKLNYTTLVDLEAMRKVFRCEALSAESAEGDKEKIKLNYTMPKRRSVGRWQKSIKSLHNYKDALVQDLLAIWDIDFDNTDEPSLKQIKNKFDIKPDPDSIVNSWLDVNMPQLQQSRTVIEDLNITIKSEKSIHIDDCANRSFNADTFGADLSTQLQSTQLPVEEIRNMHDSALDMQNDTLLLPQKPKLMKKKSKYVKGF